MSTCIGTHHGVSLLHPAYHPRQPHPHLWLPCRAREAFRNQNGAPSFPVDFSKLRRPSSRHLEPIAPSEICGFTVTPMKQHHEGTLTLSSEKDGKTVIYTTDSEQSSTSQRDRALRRVLPRRPTCDLRRMYSLADAVSVKGGWGHSSNIVRLELCQLAKARHFCLYHHEPVFDDTPIHQILQRRCAWRRSPGRTIR